MKSGRGAQDISRTQRVALAVGAISTVGVSHGPRAVERLNGCLWLQQNRGRTRHLGPRGPLATLWLSVVPGEQQSPAGLGPAESALQCHLLLGRCAGSSCRFLD